jgi:hypothetical protein
MIRFLAVTALAVAAGLASAHEDAPLQAQHGGVVVEATSGQQVELSAAGGMLMVYLHDHDGVPIASQAALAEVIVLSGAGKQVLALRPSGGNALMAAEPFSAAPGSKAVVRLTLPGQAVEQLRFVLP